MKFKHVKCNMCGIDKATTIFNDGIRIVRCAACGLAYLNPMPVGEFLARHYDEDYYLEWDKEKNGRRKMWEKRLEDVEGNHCAGKGRILDVGCGRGEFVTLAEKNGWESYGSEVSEYAVKDAQTKGLKVSLGEIANVGFPPEHFDVITMWHTLEHVLDPLGTLREIKRILSKKGVFVIEVPNLYYSAPVVKNVCRHFRLWSELQFDIRKEVHLYHFTERTLKEMAHLAGLETIKTAVGPKLCHNPPFGKGLSIRVFNAVAEIIHTAAAVNIGSSIRLYMRRH